MKKITYYNDLNKMEGLSDEEKSIGSKVGDTYKFRSNSYYNSLINWEDENDPLRRIIIPDERELISWGDLDASKESQYQPDEGLEQKNSYTA